MTIPRDLRIGYVPYDPALRSPGDRRRFCFYAEHRGLHFEIADPRKDYDVVVVSPGDISVWQRYRGRAKIIYQQVDAYLASGNRDWKALFRGPAKFAVRQNRHLLLDYAEGIRQMCRRADAVICATAEQQEDIRPYCSNVRIILDFHSTVTSKVKQDYAAGDVFNLVWEGLPGNLVYFSQIRGVLQEIRRRRPLALHLVTDLEYGEYLHGKVGRRYTTDLARRTFGTLDGVNLYAWNEQTAATIITACDLALIPLDLEHPLICGKPENKLLLFWRMAMPVIASATPAYARVMRDSGLHMACSTAQEWAEMLDRFLSDEPARRSAGLRGRQFTEQHYSVEQMLSQWDEVFASVLSRSRDQLPVTAS